MDSVAAIIFDMDGTLLDTERLALDAWQRAQGETGAEFPEGFYLELIGRAKADSQRRIAAVFGDAARQATFEAAWERHYVALAAKDGWPLRPGARETVVALHAAGIALSIATSTGSQWARPKLERAGLLSFFDAVTTGDEVTHSKPDPAIFHLARQRTGLAPDRCLVVEDSPNGVRAGVAAGLRTLLIPDLAPIPPEVRALAWRELPHLQALLPLLGLRPK